MKKFLLTTLFCCASIVLTAGTDLRVQNFLPASGGTAEVVSTGWKNYGLKLTAGAQSDVTVMYKQIFTFHPGMIYEISGDISGTGELFAELQYFDIDNKPVSYPKSKMTIRIRKDEFKAVLDLREVDMPNPPRRCKVVLGVKKGGSLLLEDMELDVEDGIDD